MPSSALPWVAIGFGWPAVIASNTLVLMGVLRGRWRVTLFGAMVGCPFLVYLFASPRIGWLSPIAGVLYLASFAGGRAIPTRARPRDGNAVRGPGRFRGLARAQPMTMTTESHTWQRHCRAAPPGLC
jgi:hypothetical protein